MMKLIKVLCLVGSLFGVVQPAYAGVVVGGTRVVYDGAKRETSISVNNPEKVNPYLIQSWVDEDNLHSGKAPFIVTPPLFRLDAGQENILRIVYTGGQLPADRESVFWLNIKSVPSSSENDNNQLLIAVKTRIKLFYRPVGLEGKAAAEAYKKLVFTQSEGNLIVSNPTAYHVSLYSLTVDGEEIEDAGMVAPKSDFSWLLPNKHVTQVRWQAINDFGGVSQEVSLLL
ncbi:molecular chaperone [Shewanella chilikensis]|uniref:fimbrial biogenesis chaperone n=1 Tax=Shewanella chilikensis TaxID=558541 RepID=UPI002010BF65|nr:molecular chaperone [Shewanella chilikensis]MCL1162081.1 molecular chaperone [Shewanella chilikensis]